MATKEIITYELSCDLCGMTHDSDWSSVDRRVEKYIIADKDADTALAVVDMCYGCKNKVVSLLRIIAVHSRVFYSVLYRKDKENG